jgi:hypothetical protein
MSVKLVNDDSLTDVADAIRIKGEISGTLEFPDGFISAIQAIPTGGITPSGTISITQNGQVDVTNYATADVNVSGGGSTYTLIDSAEYEVSIGTSTSPVIVESRNMPSLQDGFYTAVCRRKEGKTNGKFYLSYTIFFVDEGTLYGVSQLGKTVKINTDGTLRIAQPSSPTGDAGVYVSTITKVKITIQAKYNSVTSGLVDGTYIYELYATEFPPNISL